MNKFNAISGFVICLCSVLLIITFAYLRLSLYWIVLLFAVGGAGLLLTFWEVTSEQK